MGLECRSLMGDLNMCFLWPNNFMLNLMKIYTFCTILRQWMAIILIYVCELLELAHTAKLQVKIIHMNHKLLPSDTEHSLCNFFIMQNHPPQPTAIHTHYNMIQAVSPDISYLLQHKMIVLESRANEFC